MERFTGVSLRREAPDAEMAPKSRRSEHACNCVLNEAEAAHRDKGAIFLWTCHVFVMLAKVTESRSGVNRRWMWIAMGSTGWKAPAECVPVGSNPRVSQARTAYVRGRTWPPG